MILALGMVNCLLQCSSLGCMLQRVEISELEGIDIGVAFLDETIEFLAFWAF
jgi:hypothetical protein